MRFDYAKTTRARPPPQPFSRARLSVDEGSAFDATLAVGIGATGECTAASCHHAGMCGAHGGVDGSVERHHDVPVCAGV